MTDWRFELLTFSRQDETCSSRIRDDLTRLANALAIVGEQDETSATKFEFLKNKKLSLFEIDFLLLKLINLSPYEWCQQYPLG